MKKFIKNIFSTPVTVLLIISVLTNIFIETLSRNSITALISYICETPFTFIFNTAIIMLTLSISLFFKRQVFMTSLLTILWIALGIANKFMLISANTPLTVFHIANVGSGIKLSSIYMTIFEIILILAAIIAALIFVYLLWRKMPKAIRNIKRAVLSLSILFISCAAMSFATSAQAIDFSDMSSAYEKYGFAYCFSRSVLKIGIEMPDDYSKEAVEEIIEKINIEDDAPELKPNIIYVQLESFFDVKDLKNLELSEDPIPNFTALKDNYPSGYLTVSSIGGGTSNTEFEIMTGMSLSHFGIGEIPYLTFLGEQSCETVMRNLSEYGYTSTAIHSYTGTFYQRHNVFKQLGFDRFVSEELMTIPERNALSWAKDTVFLPYIRESLTSTEGPDFVYAITVQAHGKYLSNETNGQYMIDYQSENLEVKPQMDYYIGQINEVDMFVGKLIEEYSEFDEPTVIVLFGDHLPALEIEKENLKNGDIYKTEYVIWSNFELEAEDRDLEANMLTARVTDILNMTNGTINKLNTYCEEDSDFDKMSEMLAYDILYGENFANEKELLSTDMQMGLGLIKITDCYYQGNDLYVTGEGFNQYSKIMTDGNIKSNTEFVDENTLMVRNLFTFETFSVSVAQVSSDNTVLAKTGIILCEPQSPVVSFINFNNYTK